MSKTAQTDADVRAANEADQFLLDAINAYADGHNPNGISSRPEVQAVKNDVVKAQAVMAELRGLCNAHKIAISRRMANRGQTKGISLTKAFASRVS